MNKQLLNAKANKKHYTGQNTGSIGNDFASAVSLSLVDVGFSGSFGCSEQSLFSV